MDNEKLEKIEKLREEVVKIDEKIIKQRNKLSFFSFFTKSTFIAIVFVLVSNLLKLSNQGKILLFVFVFIVVNFIQFLSFNRIKNGQINDLEKEKIKIQADIFKLSRDLKEDK